MHLLDSRAGDQAMTLIESRNLATQRDRWTVQRNRRRREKLTARLCTAIYFLTLAAILCAAFAKKTPDRRGEQTPIGRRVSNRAAAIFYTTTPKEGNH
jgi:hypothetical protein